MHKSSGGMRVTAGKRTATLLARAGAVVAGLGAVSLLVVTTTHAAFSASTDNSGNSFAAGTVTLSDDDAGTLLFNLADMKPGDTATKCVNVSYSGSLPSNIRLYGNVGGNGLAAYLTTSIDVGNGAAGGSSLSCAGFTSTQSLLNGTLASFATANTNYGNGLGGFDGATNPSSMSYRVSVTLQDDNAAQGKTATATFTWEAQNV